MVISVSIANGTEGTIKTRIRELDGTLNYGRLQGILDNYPEALTPEEAFDLLKETTNLLRENNKELSAAQHQIKVMKKTAKKRDQLTSQNIKRDLRKNLELFKSLNAKKPRQTSRETIRREMMIHADELEESESDDDEDYVGEVCAI